MPENRDTVRFGFAQNIITPKAEHVYLDGYGERVTPAEGVIDDLYVKTFTISSGRFRHVLAVFDACGFEERIASSIRHTISYAAGLDVNNVTVCATHTHSSPASGVLGDLPVNYYWWSTVGETAAQTALKAFENAAVCKIDFTVPGKLEHIYNRRGRPDCDKNIKSCFFYDSQGELKGALVLAACHATCNSSNMISADYPGILTREFAKQYPGASVIFLQGAGADIDPSAEAELLGKELADCVLNALQSRSDTGHHVVEVSKIKPAVISDDFDIPMQSYADIKSLEENLNFFENLRYKVNRAFDKRRVLREIYWHQSAIRSALLGQSSNYMRVQIKLLVLSDEAVFVFIPFEVFTSTGHKLVEMFVNAGYKKECIYIVSHGDGTNGYLAPAKELEGDEYRLHYTDSKYWYAKTLEKNAPDTDEVAYGYYETVSAPHWYGLNQCSVESEYAVLKTVNNLIKSAGVLPGVPNNKLY